MPAVAGKRARTKGSSDGGADVAPDTHTLELTIWDVPSAVNAGERFAVSAGARCSAGCDLAGKAVTLFDQHGAPACTAELGRAVWPGTEALYFAQAETRAPLEAGSHQWEAKMAGWDGESPHTDGVFPLTVRVVPAAECEVTVKAIDRESRAPIAGARVVIHPYRAVTDNNGIARVKVSKGQYDVLVSWHRYLPYCASIEVTADMSTSAELDADLPDEEAYE
jgi:hypothetical protein